MKYLKTFEELDLFELEDDNYSIEEIETKGKLVGDYSVDEDEYDVPANINYGFVEIFEYKGRRFWIVTYDSDKAGKSILKTEELG